MKHQKWIKRVLAAGVIAVSSVAGTVTWQGYNLYQQAMAAKPIAQMVADIQAKEHYTPLSELPQIYLDAVLSVEDHRFYQHPGIDLLAILRAAFNDLRTLSLAEGGSTITQQLAKNEWFTQEKKFTRKVAELFLALELERELDKDKILELYVNSINFGSGYYCVADASQGYFNKRPSEMTDWEATILAGIPNAPSAYSLDASPQLARQRRLRVLERMVICKTLSQEEAEKILEQNHIEYEDKIYFVHRITLSEKENDYAIA